MITNICMLALVAFMAFIVLYKMREADSDAFFNAKNTKAMRGFWCLVVILVHTPAPYRNRIQDMLGSFGYIGVSFFFMTSAYGLKTNMLKNPESIHVFWRNRLPKLLIPCFLVNVVKLIFTLITSNTLTLTHLLNLNTWVQWLLVCYLVFWLVHRLTSFTEKTKDFVICGTVITLSFFVYILNDYFSSTTWATEVWGFAWGILLANIAPNLKRIAHKRWLSKCISCCIIAVTLGVMYLQFKPVVFWGDYLLKILLGLAILLFMLMCNTKIDIGNKISLFLGDISFEMYLIHGIVFSIIWYYFRDIPSGVYILASILLSAVLSKIIHTVSSVLFKSLNHISSKYQNQSK